MELQIQSFVHRKDPKSSVIYYHGECLWPLLLGLRELVWKWLSYNTLLCVQAHWGWRVTTWPGTCPSKRDKRAHLMIAERGWNFSELTSPSERLCNRMPLWQSHHLVRLAHLPPLWRQMPNAFFFSAAPPSIVNTSSQGNAAHFRALSFRCHYLLFYSSPFLCSVKRRCAEVRRCSWRNIPFSK